MQTAILTFQHLFMRDERVTTLSTGGLVVLMMIGIGLVSLSTLNSKATKGYVLNQLEEERQELVVDGEVTDMLILRARSLSEIEAKAIGMVKPKSGDVAYVTPLQVVAQR